jgi:hypothetical protein
LLTLFGVTADAAQVGRIHTRNFKAQPDAQVVAVSEVYLPRMDAACDLVGGPVAQDQGWGLLDSVHEEHHTPSGATQAFVYCLCRVGTG